MVVLGVDPHKKTHTVVAADEAGRQLSTITVPATAAGHLKLFGCVTAAYPQRRWAVEDGRHVAGRLLRDLIAAGESVTCVPTKLMAGARAAARTRGKSDPIDALAWPAPRYASPSYRRPTWTTRAWTCGSWLTIANTWSPNGPATSTGCVAIWSTWIPPWTRRPVTTQKVLR